MILNSKTGEVLRIPVKLRDISRVTVEMLTQRDNIRKAPMEREKEEHQADRLLKLAEQFAEFAKAVGNTKSPKREIEIEGEIIEDAVYEEPTKELAWSGPKENPSHMEESVTPP